MPPKSKITRDMIVDAAVKVARETGAEAVNARTVAQTLHCSTQPVMYHFSTMEELKRAAYSQADRFHTDYLMHSSGKINPLLEIGLHYIRFAIEEPHLFRFLFQSGYAKESNLSEMIASEELAPVLSAMQEGLKMDPDKTRKVFLTVALFAHGYASIIANNALEFDERTVAAHLERAFNGAVLAVRQEENDEKTV
ncbi:MAG: TetR/AcrR family transcriptional regulator [Oscillospiraceae bacterium]|nr:TetR/AcrR family transcriptional regulator [Oscillospiraceae bacterium]